MKVLVTSGATREAIDGVRFLTNFSTGATGAALADYFRAQGHSVAYLHGAGAARPRSPRGCAEFGDFADLDRRLQELLRRRRFDLILHLAAVSDFSVASVTVGARRCSPARLAKLDSRAPVRLELKKNFKILDRLPRYARNRPLIVGFKLTNGAGSAAVRRAVGRLQADLVVHNDRRDMSGGRRRFAVYEAGALKARCLSRGALARSLHSFATRRMRRCC